LTGERLTGVVTKVVQAELERQQHQRGIQARVDHVMKIARELRAHMRELASSDRSWLYAEDGLPK